MEELLSSYNIIKKNEKKRIYTLGYKNLIFKVRYYLEPTFNDKQIFIDKTDCIRIDGIFFTKDDKNFVNYIKKNNDFRECKIEIYKIKKDLDEFRKIDLDFLDKLTLERLDFISNDKNDIATEIINEFNETFKGFDVTFNYKAELLKLTISFEIVKKELIKICLDVNMKYNTERVIRFKQILPFDYENIECNYNPKGILKIIDYLYNEPKSRLYELFDYSNMISTCSHNKNIHRIMKNKEPLNTFCYLNREKLKICDSKISLDKKIFNNIDELKEYLNTVEVDKRDSKYLFLPN